MDKMDNTNKKERGLIMLTQREFVRYVAANGNFTIADAKVFVPAVFDALAKAVMEHEAVAIPAFGTFKIASKQGYLIPSFKDKSKMVQVPTKYKILFVQSRRIKNLLNPVSDDK